jgi:hypothetical protein
VDVLEGLELLSCMKGFSLEILNITWQDCGGVIGEESSSTSLIVTVLQQDGGAGGSAMLSSIGGSC